MASDTMCLNTEVSGHISDRTMNDRSTYTAVGNNEMHSGFALCEIILSHSQRPQAKSTSSNYQEIDICNKYKLGIN